MTDSNLRILQMCSSSAVSGAERHVFALSTNLRQRGHYVQVITPGPGWLPNALFEEEIPHHQIAMRGKGWLNTLGYTVRQIQRQKIDVVHTHLTRTAYIGHAAGLITRVPIITSVHIANNDNIYRRLARKHNRLVAVSDFVRGMLHGRGVPDRFIDTVYNGTDLLDIPHTDPLATKRTLGIDADKKVVSIVGRVCREKGHVEMIRAMKSVTAEHKDAHLMMVGRVVPGFEDELESELSEAKLHHRVTLTGERQDIPALLDAVSISAMPSYIETFGVAAVEAMARSKPVVASRVGGLPEVVKDGQTGILVDLEPDDIAKAVSYLLTNDHEREAMGIRARQAVEERFTTQRMVDRFESIYAKAARS